MQFLDLEPEALVAEEPGRFRAAKDNDHAQGIWFLCPTCFRKNNGPIGTHMVLVWFANAGTPDWCKPAPRWTVCGTGYHDLTIHPSINVDNEHWHGWIQNGQVLG